jgi:hypothetical protein
VTRAARAAFSVAALLATAVVLLGGCRARVRAGDSDGGVDAAVPGDASNRVDGGGVDLGGCAVGPEICNNGCDDDRNGYTDADDPACTAQLLVTFQMATPSLERLILEPQPHLVVLDGNPVAAQSFALHHRALSSDAYSVGENDQHLYRIMLGDGGVAGSPLTYYPHALCTFNGQLIVVERTASSVLHRLKADGTELGTVPLANLMVTSCASDGNLLYVAAHNPAGGASQFLLFDSTFTQVGTAAVPTALASAGLNHVLAFAWTKKTGTFYGLFSSDLSSLADLQGASQLYPFALDGGSGAPVDAGTLHGVGEFLP